MGKLLLVDCDGTIREPLSNHRFIEHPKDQRIIRGAKKAIAHFHSQDYLIIGITNQGGCSAVNPETGKPYKSIGEAIAEQRYTLELLPQIHKIYFCPDFEGKTLGVVYSTFERVWQPEGYSSFRKPSPGMLEHCLQTHEVGEVIMVGDRLEDRAAAEAAGIEFMEADQWREKFS